MKKLLQLSTSGIKNIERPITIDFANQTINNGINKVNNIKGIYGYNGAGKTAFITAMYFYKNIILNSEFLMQNDIKNQLNDLINKNTNVYTCSTTFDIGSKGIVKHSIEVTKNPDSGNIRITKENLGLLTGRTLNEKYVPIAERINNKVTVYYKLSDSEKKYLNEVEELNASIVSLYINRLFEDFSSRTNNALELSNLDSIMIHFYASAGSIEVCRLKSDDYSINSYALEQVLNFLSRETQSNLNLDTFNFYGDDDILVNGNELKAFETENKRLVKFLKLFKPELIDIKLKKEPSGSKYHISRTFVYYNYEVAYKYESSGIKQLVNLFTYLKKCADGNVVFIDEMDVNINTVYFKKLVSYFANFGKGQLIFTTHNIESMDAIKNQRRAINAIGNDGTLETWVGVGNRSPIKDYMGGYFIHSPMNIEDFDFISIFEGE